MPARPTAATLLDRVYMQDGVAQGEAALGDIAREDATANHIAFKFACHFVADAPDAALVQRLAASPARPTAIWGRWRARW